MPNYYQAKNVAARRPLNESERSGAPMVNVSEYLVQSAAFGVGDIIEFAGVPAYHVLDTITVLSDQVDSNGTPTITYDLDFLTGAPSDLAGLVAGTRTMSTTLNPGAAGVPLRAGGQLASTVVAMGRQVASTSDRNIGMKITAVAATQVAAARIRLRVCYIADPGQLS